MIKVKNILCPTDLSRSMLIILLTLSALAINTAVGAEAWRTYQGAWFEIKYPANFEVRPSLQSSSAHGYDSVFFAAPGGEIEFYVFSPQWNGRPTDIELKSGEVLVAQSVEKKGGKTIRRISIRARDGSYLRAFEDTEDATTNTRKVFGVRYRNQATYNSYRQTYLTFKTSLRQFAD